MKKIAIGQLIAAIEKKLLSTFGDQTLCTQYAWWLVQAITGKSEITLITHNEIAWGDAEQNKLDDALDKLINQHMPLQYLLGSTPFCGLDILVKSPVLIPRPETEEWCANLIEQLAPLRNDPLWILDLCTGSGCIALALADALPQAKIYGTDINDTALALAQENARHNSIANAQFIRSDLFAAIPQDFTFDLIVGNPPYIPESEWPTLDKSVTQWEAKEALIAPDQGLALIKKIITGAPKYIKSHALLHEKNIPQVVLEIDHTQGASVADYMRAGGYNQITIQKDLEGKDRVASGRVDHVAITHNSR